MPLNWIPPGARWWKFDFHTHTPASKDTHAWQTAVGTPNALTPEKWLLKYMAAGIDCVAVTDHNSGEWIDTLKAAYKQMQQAAEAGQPATGFRALHLFPGVEISIQGGFHLLAIFDPSATGQTISDLLAQVEYDGTRGDSNGVTRKGAADVIERIVRNGGLPIPAHSDGEKGLLEVVPNTLRCRIDANTVRQAIEVPGILAVEWRSLATPKPQIWTDLKLKLTQVVGSDCHSFQGVAVPGSSYTWVKMASPSLEGLRLALLDGQDVSIRRSDDGNHFDPNKKPEHFIESIEIARTKCMGLGTTPALLEFNPCFNAIVGGRGTGKSTVIHALRIAYQREKELPGNSEAGQTFFRFYKEAKNKNGEGGLRSDTQIKVRVNRDGLSYRLIWQQNGQGHAVEVWDASTQSFKPDQSQAINKQRFALRLFSQGQIAALASDGHQALLTVIDDAARTSDHRTAFESAKSAFLATQAQLRELDNKLKAREALEQNRQDVVRKLARFEVADHASILKNYQRTSRQTRELDRQLETAAILSTRIQNFAQELLAEDWPDGLFDGAADGQAIAILQQIHSAVTTTKKETERAASQLARQGQQLKAELESSAWFTHATATKAAYQQLKIDLQQQGINDPSEYGRLVQEKLRLDHEILRLDALQKQRELLHQQAQQQFRGVAAARQAISACRQAFLDETLADNPFVHIALIPYSRDARALERSLREVLGTPEDKYKDDMYAPAPDQSPATGLIADVLMLHESGGEGSGNWNSTEFENQLNKAKKRLRSACQGRGDFGAWFNKFLVTETDKRPELPDHILCWFPEDGLEVKYSRRGDGNNFQPIAQASAGQRAAAMLAFLLAHGSEPLVLDQPEDDLDNHLIYSLVVQQIRINKLNRQLIIVTHNPNIVVNGDAEWIHVLDFNNQCYVKQTGSLQDQPMRTEICEVMEGGHEAFERRYQRLGKEV